jgi:SAM-dependent methyltransferase
MQGPLERPSYSEPSRYWDGVLGATLDARPIEPWRAYMRNVYVGLMRRWMPSSRSGPSLKTDLFEEAVTDHELLSELGPGSVGLDCSPAIAANAHRRLEASGRGLRFVVGDVRHIPLRGEVVARILAGSSLDHFPDKGDIEVSLRELARVLAPGGTLVLTLDNPHNPVVWLRNRLPITWLHRAHLVPYYIGATYSLAEGRSHLEALGFIVTDIVAVAHAPRAPAIVLAALAGRLRWPRVSGWLGRVLTAFESLERWPTRYRTGYYLAFRAEKRTEPSSGPGRPADRSTTPAAETR